MENQPQQNSKKPKPIFYLGVVLLIIFSVFGLGSQNGCSYDAGECGSLAIFPIILLAGILGFILTLIGLSSWIASFQGKGPKLIIVLVCLVAIGIAIYLITHQKV